MFKILLTTLLITTTFSISAANKTWTSYSDTDPNSYLIANVSPSNTLNYFIVVEDPSAVGVKKAYGSFVFNRTDRISLVKRGLNINGKSAYVFEPSDEDSFKKIGTTLSTKDKLCIGFICFPSNDFYQTMKSWDLGY